MNFKSVTFFNKINAQQFSIDCLMNERNWNDPFFFQKLAVSQQFPYEPMTYKKCRLTFPEAVCLLREAGMQIGDFEDFRYFSFLAFHFFLSLCDFDTFLKWNLVVPLTRKCWVKLWKRSMEQISLLLTNFQVKYDLSIRCLIQKTLYIFFSCLTFTLTVISLNFWIWEFFIFWTSMNCQEFVFELWKVWIRYWMFV
jgi:hypothetical protein